MSRKESKAILLGNGPMPQQEEFGLDQPTPEEICRTINEVFKVGDKRIEKMREYTEVWRSMNQRLTCLEHDSRQSRLAMETDGPTNAKTRERTKVAGKAVQAKHGESCTAQRVQDRAKTLTCFGVMAEIPTFPCREDVSVENDTAMPKSCLLSFEMRSPTAAAGLFPTGGASIATMTTYNQPHLRLYSTKETDPTKMNLRTPILYVSHDSSFVPAVPSCRRVIEIKSEENSMLDPGSSHVRLRACPFLGSWSALLHGEVHVRGG